MTKEEIINEIKCILSELDNGEDAVSYLTQNDIKWLNENIKMLEQKSNTAHWIKIDILGKYECSNCGNTIWAEYPYDWFPYCCTCGSKMIPND